MTVVRDMAGRGGRVLAGGIVNGAPGAGTAPYWGGALWPGATGGSCVVGAMFEATG
jgi:hypothetical protein